MSTHDHHADIIDGMGVAWCPYQFSESPSS